MSTGAPRTLADQLRGWSDERLAVLLDARPDLAQPAPTDTAQLASRAAIRISAGRALDQLDRLHLEVLLAVVQLGPVDVATIGSVVAADDVAIAAAAERLADLALVWGPIEATRPVAIVGDMVGLPPGPDADRVQALIAELDDHARGMLDHLDAADAVGTVAGARTPTRVEDATTPLEQLLARGLLVARDERHVLVPWTVRLHLRGGKSTRVPVGAAPSFADSERDQALVDRAGAGAAFEFVRRTEMLLDDWASPATGRAALRAGSACVSCAPRPTTCTATWRPRPSSWRPPPRRACSPSG